MPPKSPYNFVPAPEWKDVFKPDWADQVTHDQPFSDGESGEIEIDIVAETPIFIRSGKEPRDKTQYFPSYIKDGKKTHYIPGSSIKGMFRNVLEIMSRSMLNPGFVANNRFFYRDLRNGSHYKAQYDTQQVKAGWLSLDENSQWQILPSDWCFIRHDVLDTYYNNEIKFKRTFLKRQPYENYSLPSKYRMSEGKYGDLEELFYERDVNFNIEIIRNHRYTRRVAVPDENGKGRFNGTIVFTGQPGLRNEQDRDKSRHTGKVHEFVFFNDGNTPKIISPDVVKDFKFSHQDHDPNVKNDWKRFRKFIYEGDMVPVFYQEREGMIVHFGLAYLYKLPYKKSIHDIRPLTEYLDQSNGDTSGVMDLAKTIFGHASKDDGLKGRVSVSHAICTNEVAYPHEVSIVLGQPKASYYPHYLADPNTASAYDNSNAKLSGFKRYFNRKSCVTRNMGEANHENKKIITPFKPLHAGSVFKAFIRFHNLRKCELGALLSAITFHGNDDYVRHQLGGAKPYGFGKVKVNVKGISGVSPKLTRDDAMKCFEKLMTENAPNPIKKWFTSDTICALFSMGSGKVNDIQELTYPTLREHQNKESQLSKPIYDKNRINRFYHEE